jgi:hypothetical protein
VIDLRGGSVSARKLAAAVGHSEKWVRSRLALLSLPDVALDALHSGAISIDVATALTPAADHPDLIDDLVATDGLTVWRVESAHRQHLDDLAIDETIARLEATGVRAVTEDDWRENRTTWKTLDELGLDQDAHRGEPCHVVVVRTRYDHGVVEIGACTEPRRHRGRKPASELVVPTVEPTEAERAANVERRERRLASEARRDWLTDRLRNGRQIAAADAFPLAIATWIDIAPHMVLEKAAKLLGIEHPESGYVDYSAILAAHVNGEPKRLTGVAVALAAATTEERARHESRSPVVARYLDTIERLGYQLTDWEHTQRLTATS